MFQAENNLVKPNTLNGSNQHTDVVKIKLCNPLEITRLLLPSNLYKVQLNKTHTFQSSKYTFTCINHPYNKHRSLAITYRPSQTSLSLGTLEG